VLRHYRVVTRLASNRPALLIDYTGLKKDFSKVDEILPFRTIFEAVLLDEHLRIGFDALERLASFANDTAPVVSDPGDTKFVLFQMKFRTVGKDGLTSPCSVTAKVRDTNNDIGQGRERILVAPNGVDLEIADQSGFGFPDRDVLGQGVPRGGPMAWRDVGFLVLEFQPGVDTADGKRHTNVTSIDVSAVDEAGIEHSLGHAGDILVTQDTPGPNRLVMIAMTRPPQKPAAIEPRMRLSEAERIASDHLLTHLRQNAIIYNRALWLFEDPSARADRFASLEIKGIPVLDLIENRAVEVSGTFVAFPTNVGEETKINVLFNPDFIATPPPENDFIEQLLTLPTRGVFGEAKLGHCNASELIDDQRFWDWQKSPIQFAPPDITGVDAASRAHDPTGLTPTAFPTSLLNIVNPGALPDPTGLANALKVIGTPGIFRDQSGLQEVGTALGKLSDNATSLAAAALQGQNRKDLIDTIEKSGELTSAQKKDLIGQLLTGQVGQASKPPVTGTAGSTGSTGAGGVGSGLGSPPATGGVRPPLIPCLPPHLALARRERPCHRLPHPRSRARRSRNAARRSQLGV
jgi:hypothetical protein